MIIAAIRKAYTIPFKIKRRLSFDINSDQKNVLRVSSVTPHQSTSTFPSAICKATFIIP